MSSLKYLFFLSMVAAPATLAQTSIAPAALASADMPQVHPSSAPIPPFLGSYHYWPQMYMQWVGQELPYSMVQVYFDRKSTPPLMQAILTDRATQHRAYYVNQQKLVDDLHRSHQEAYLTQIGLKEDGDGAGATSEFTFQAHDGQAVRWRFVQATDVMGQASGLTESKVATSMLLLYRESGAVAGQGTALQVGNSVSEAEPWKEISHPPYFVAYRGSLTDGTDVASLIGGDVQWHQDEAPASLTEGQGWKLTANVKSSTGESEPRPAILHIDHVAGDLFELTLTDLSDAAATRHITARNTPDGWSIEAVRYGEAQHNFIVKFEPGLPLSAAKAGVTRFAITEGKNTKVAGGEVAFTASGQTDEQLTWSFKDPEWAKAAKLAETLGLSSGGVHLQASFVPSTP